MIAWAATGSLASTNLAGCASSPIAHISPEVVAVPVRDAPPADLLACPETPKPFPMDAAATMPRAVRAALLGLALGYRDLSDRQSRLVNWFAPGSCAPHGVPAK